MYGKFNNYFNSNNKQFHNSIWIELIGFEKNSPDFGVDEYLKTTGFVPDSVSLHLTSVDFVNTHTGMDNEYILPPYVCSYGGHAENDQRKRQDWTNYDLRGLISALHLHGIKVLASFFDMVSDDRFISQHPELLADGSNGHEDGILMIKRFRDGSYYEDFLLQKLITVISDYDLDGVQLADGISSPRNAIWFADFSDDIIEQSGFIIPTQEQPSEYIPRMLRRNWIEFYQKRWSNFLTKIITGLKAVGAIVAVNSAWTRDPFEALYRYGTDYKTIEAAGADYFVVEDVSSDLAILGYEDNHNYKFSYNERKMVHFEFLANLMAINAANPDLCPTPLFMIWDNQEQWDVLHHAPTAMQRAAAANFTHFCIKDGIPQPITGGPHFCLGDALSSDDWKFIRLCIDNGYTPNACATEGAIFIWSTTRMKNELDEFISHGTYHSAKWLAVLMRAGAMISEIADISQLDKLRGNIVISNYSLLSEEEKFAVDAYKNGMVIKAEYYGKCDVSTVLNPKEPGWPKPLIFDEPPTELIKSLVKIINDNVNISLLSCNDECSISEVKTGKNTSKITVENNEYYYVLPVIKTKRRIKKIRIITKPNGYPLQYSEHDFRVRVAGRGADIAEIEYYDE